MRKLLLSTALTLGVGAFALQSPAIAFGDTLNGGEFLGQFDTGEGQLGLTAAHSLVLAAVAFHYFTPRGGLLGDNLFVGPDTNGTWVQGTDTKRENPTVNVYGTVDKKKDKRVVELVLKLKIAVIIVAQLFRGKTAAEADLIVDQQNNRNTVDHTETGDTLFPTATRKGSVELTAKIADSVTYNIGVTQLNQDTGNMVNQANVLSAAVSATPVFADSQAAAEQQNNWNRSRTIEVVPSGSFIPTNAQKTALIARSVNWNTGVTLVNQNVGNMNNQLNAVSMAVGLEADFALADAYLGQFNTNNRVVERNTIRTATIAASINNNTGITGVNQATGNLNNQASVISFAGSAKF